VLSMPKFVMYFAQQEEDVGLGFGFTG
jgi:hypothetical protein